jgi:hypothetical protein
MAFQREIFHRAFFQIAQCLHVIREAITTVAGRHPSTPQANERGDHHGESTDKRGDHAREHTHALATMALPFCPACRDGGPSQQPDRANADTIESVGGEPLHRPSGYPEQCGRLGGADPVVVLACAA